MDLEEQCISEFIKAFMLAKEAQGLTPGTLRFYHYKLKLFTDYGDIPIGQITPFYMRVFLQHLAKNHNPAGVHAVYRSLKTLFHFCEGELAPGTWLNPWTGKKELGHWYNPFNRIKAPKVPEIPPEPISSKDITALLKVSNVRDSCLILFFLDSGARSFEALALDTKDVNLLTGEILLRRTKGQKYRVCFIGTKTRKALKKYLSQRVDDDPALFVTDEGTRLTYLGLRSIMYRRCKDAGISPPIKIHGLRKTFALSMLQSGISMESLRVLLGHSDYSTIQKYLRLTNKDIQLDHKKHSPVDNML
jgi:integrase/recombinase XerD